MSSTNKEFLFVDVWWSGKVLFRTQVVYLVEFVILGILFSSTYLMFVIGLSKNPKKSESESESAKNR